MESFTRHPAVKILISDLNKGDYIQNNEQSPNYLELKDKKIYRLNLIAALVEKEVIGSITNLLLDDGTGKIILRSFEENKNIENLCVGDVVLVIGKIRTYNDERYISPEIVKWVEPLWLKLRSLELKNEISGEESVVNKDEENITTKVDGVDEVEEKNGIIEKNDLLPNQKVISLIKELDGGSGVLMEEIIEKSVLDNVEVILDRMLEAGEIFQIQPGRVKVL